MRLSLSILILFISNSVVLLSFSSHIIATDVRFREKPVLKSKVISTLSKNTKLTVLKVFSKRKFIGKYFGSWCKVKMGQKVGYIFSAFIKDGKEKFHIFYKKFYGAVKASCDNERKVNTFLKERISFPFSLEVFDTMGSEKKMISRSTFLLSHIYGGDGNEGSPMFSFSKKRVRVYIDYYQTGCAHRWLFHQVKGRWFLVANDMSSY